MTALLEVVGLLLLIYWLAVGLGHWVRSEHFWNMVFDLGPDPPRAVHHAPKPSPELKPWPKPWPAPLPRLLPLETLPKPAPPPRVRKSLGEHINALALPPAPQACQGEFEQMDARTWQCTRCHLLHFEVPSEEAHS
jgi:hypothetical protein